MPSLEVWTVIIMMFTPGGGYETEKWPVEVATCQTVDGKRVEDSTCGVRACLLKGKERASVLWGRMPGTGFQIICNKGDQKSSKSAEPAGGHAGVNWQ